MAADYDPYGHRRDQQVERALASGWREPVDAPSGARWVPEGYPQPIVDHRAERREGYERIRR